MFEFSVNSMVRGYHVYQEVWEVRIGEVLPCLREVRNRHDPYAIAVKDELVIGHLPHKISCIYSIFIRRGSEEHESCEEHEAVELSAYEMYYG